MDEISSVLRSLQPNFTERNSALFCFLGILSVTSWLTRDLEEEAKRRGSAPRAMSDERNPLSQAPRSLALSPFDCLVLGLISFGQTAATVARTAGAAERIRAEDESQSTPPELREVLR
jgi:hypothetical protein